LTKSDGWKKKGIWFTHGEYIPSLVALLERESQSSSGGISLVRGIRSGGSDPLPTH
jgi:hypothetical protein